MWPFKSGLIGIKIHVQQNILKYQKRIKDKI